MGRRISGLTNQQETEHDQTRTDTHQNTAFAKRDYEKALSEYFVSYRLVPNRNVLFNIARCYEAMGESNLAWRYWHDVSLDATVSAADMKNVDAALNRLTRTGTGDPQRVA